MIRTSIPNPTTCDSGIGVRLEPPFPCQSATPGAWLQDSIRNPQSLGFESLGFVSQSPDPELGIRDSNRDPNPKSLGAGIEIQSCCGWNTKSKTPIYEIRGSTLTPIPNPLKPEFGIRLESPIPDPSIRESVLNSNPQTQISGIPYSIQSPLHPQSWDSASNHQPKGLGLGITPIPNPNPWDSAFYSKPQPRIP